jgi:hypothetical protein
LTERSVGAATARRAGVQRTSSPPTWLISGAHCWHTASAIRGVQSRITARLNFLDYIKNFCTSDLVEGSLALANLRRPKRTWRSFLAILHLCVFGTFHRVMFGTIRLAVRASRCMAGVSWLWNGVSSWNTGWFGRRTRDMV